MLIEQDIDINQEKRDQGLLDLVVQQGSLSMIQTFLQNGNLTSKSIIAGIERIMLDSFVLNYPEAKQIREALFNALSKQDYNSDKMIFWICQYPSQLGIEWILYYCCAGSPISNNTVFYLKLIAILTDIIILVAPLMTTILLSMLASIVYIANNGPPP